MSSLRNFWDVLMGTGQNAVRGSRELAQVPSWVDEMFPTLKAPQAPAPAVRSFQDIEIPDWVDSMVDDFMPAPSAHGPSKFPGQGPELSTDDVAYAEGFFGTPRNDLFQHVPGIYQENAQEYLQNLLRPQRSAAGREPRSIAEMVAMAAQHGIVPEAPFGQVRDPFSRISPTIPNLY